MNRVVSKNKLLHYFLMVSVSIPTVFSTNSAYSGQAPLTGYKVSEQSTTDCRKLVTGTYLTTNSGKFGSFRGIITFTEDGNVFVSDSFQSGVPSVQPFGNIQGSWKCIGDTEISATTLNFNYQTATLRPSIGRGDFRAKFEPKTGTVQATATLRIFSLNANPLVDYAPIAGTFTFTGQRIKP